MSVEQIHIQGVSGRKEKGYSKETSEQNITSEKTGYLSHILKGDWKFSGIKRDEIIEQAERDHKGHKMMKSSKIKAEYSIYLECHFFML